MKKYNDSIRISQYVEPIFSTPDDIGHWFGYYNYDTLNHDQSKMLAQQVKCEAKDISAEMEVECGYFDISSGGWHHIGYSDSYNWPQGSMLQWIPGKGNENKVIYNKSKNGHLVSTIHDIVSGKDRDLSWSIYGLTPDGTKSIALDMERSYWCRAYHYYSVVNKSLDVPVVPGDGIFEIDLERNTRKLLIDIQDVIKIDKEPYFERSKHWLEHIMISPSGKRFCFLHRYTIGSLSDYETRLFVADIDGGNLQIVDGWRTSFWSHFGWCGDDAFAIYTRPISRMVMQKKVDDFMQGKSNEAVVSTPSPSMMRRIFDAAPSFVRNIIKQKMKAGKQYYQYYSIKADKFVLTDIFDNKEFYIDGHPSFSNDGRYMITDSYPDPSGYQRLMMYDIQTKKVIFLAKVKALINEERDTCDLHPKWSKNNDYLAIDTAYNDKHHMVLFRLNWNLLKSELSK